MIDMDDEEYDKPRADHSQFGVMVAECRRKIEAGAAMEELQWQYSRIVRNQAMLELQTLEGIAGRQR